MTGNKKIKQMLNKILTLLLFVTTLSSILAQTEITPVEHHGHLQVSGNRIVDQHEQEAQLRGMSFYWSQWSPRKYYTPGVVKWFRDDWKCSVLRAAMAVEEGSGSYIDDSITQIERVETVIDAAIENGIYIIIDWHTHHAEDYEDEAKAFFGYMAQKYGSYDNVIYEIYNEPLNVSWNTVIKPYSASVIAEIRKYDPDNLILAGNRSWSARPDEAVTNPIDDPNVAYVMHYYAASHGQNHRNKVQAALDGGLAVFVSEFGTCEADGNGDIDIEESNIWWDYLKKNNISWCNWSVADLTESTAALKSGASVDGGWDVSELSISGKFVRERLRNEYEAFSSDTLYKLVLITSPITLKPDSSVLLEFELQDYEGNFITDTLDFIWTIDGGTINDTNLLTVAKNEGLFQVNVSAIYKDKIYATKFNYVVNSSNLDTWNDDLYINQLLALSNDTSYILDGTLSYPGNLFDEIVNIGDTVITKDDDTLSWKHVIDEDGIWSDSAPNTTSFYAIHLVSPFAQAARIKFTTAGQLSVWVNGEKVINSIYGANDILTEYINLYSNENTIVFTYRSFETEGGFKFEFVDGFENDLPFKSFIDSSRLTSVKNLDCSNTWLGTAYLDTCNLCVGGNTGRSECGVQLPYLGEPVEIPGNYVESENFDFGGEGISYSDETFENEGGEYRGESVDIDVGGLNYSVGWTSAGEWLEYTVRIEETRHYYLRMRVASNITGSAFHYEIDGKNISGTIEVPNTGGWDTWKVLASDPIPLDSGLHVIRVFVEKSGVNMDYFFAVNAPNQDCMLVSEGEAYRNDCGICIGGTSPISPNDDEAICVTAITKKEGLNSTIYPNPSSNGFNIESSELKLMYSINSISGTQVEAGNWINGTKVGINLPPGTYFIQLWNEQSTQTLTLNVE